MLRAVSRLPTQPTSTFSQLTLWLEFTQVVSTAALDSKLKTPLQLPATSSESSELDKDAWAEHPSRHPQQPKKRCEQKTMRGLVLAVLLTTTTAATETLFDLFGISQVELPGLDDS